jgi:hypothetical protein
MLQSVKYVINDTKNTDVCLWLYNVVTYVEKVLGNFVGVGNQSEFVTLKLKEVLFPIYEFSPYEQFSSNKLLS